LTHWIFSSEKDILSLSPFLTFIYIMAVPKKRLSKSKTQLRKTKWREKALEQAKKAFARAFSEFQKRPTQEGE
jgi:hypothetical protein